MFQVFQSGPPQQQWPVPAGVTSINVYAQTGQISIPPTGGPPTPPNSLGAYAVAMNVPVVGGTDVIDIFLGMPGMSAGNAEAKLAGVTLAKAVNSQGSPPTGKITIEW